ncbi:MAG: ubiquinone biosynthesis methyltransferase UbiE [Rhodospirillaceae bacterium]|nr:ubiquinone biosynthesis methyltransferase UbiE [Rhodospirillaceae bacterium]
MATLLEKLSYRVSQQLRAGWFSSHYAATARLSPPSRPKTNSEKQKFPDTKAIVKDLKRLFARDWTNIEAGLYQAPEDQWPNPLAVLRQSTRYFRDLKKVNQRKYNGGVQEVAKTNSTMRLPDYYLQNFHYQSDGYLSAESAQLYDYQVEVLFTGGADAMRRQALVPINSAIRQKGMRNCRLLDVGCGTGRFLKSIKQNSPRLNVSGLDLSRPYLDKAQSNLAPWSRHSLVQSAAESMPFADDTFDVISCVYLFHELPRPVRYLAAAEMSRVLKPDGVLVFMDSLQPDDFAPFNPLLEQFPQEAHEPYYADYLKDDLHALFARNGLVTEVIDRAFFSRIMVLTPEL